MSRQNRNHYDNMYRNHSARAVCASRNAMHTDAMTAELVMAEALCALSLILIGIIMIF